MNSIAHIRSKDGVIQSVESHLIEVKELAEKYGDKIKVKHLCGLAGLLHDVGKFSNEFRTYIINAVNNPETAPRGSVDHSTAGGKLLFGLFHTSNDEYLKLLSQIIGNVIISHHSYLQDYLDLSLNSKYLERVRDKEIPEFNYIKEQFFKRVINEKDFCSYIDSAKNELVEYLKVEGQSEYARRIMFLTKYIFSVLIDADRTNSREFEENSYEALHFADDNNLFLKHYEQLIRKINEFKIKDTYNSHINNLRNQMSTQCDLFAQKKSGIFTLSIPTGGGKTLASLRYALKHASMYKKKRIIYIVPYTTIIEQNASETRKILNDYENILEHHSNIINDYTDDEEEYDYKARKLKLAKDNWDSPIIFTTMVQFLDTFYANSNRNIRRLHNLTNSIIIFDEVQKVPVKCISLFNHAVNFLKTYGKSSIILCTATQPALGYVKHKLNISPNPEIITNLNEIVDEFKRVNIIDKVTKSQFTQMELVEFTVAQLNKVNNMLIILNTKKAVKDLYEELKGSIKNVYIYHLSTSMCPKHRADILTEVKKCLDNNEKLICVSTQLIEAGVDISFESVIRSLAGLDSIAQAAGRCNRHGENKFGNVYVVDYANENLSKLKEIAKGKEITRRILIDINKNKLAHGGSLLSTQAMERYFREFYEFFESDLDYPIKNSNETMIDLLMSEGIENNYLKSYLATNKRLPELSIANSYHTAAKNFQVIHDLTTSVIVPYGEGEDIIADLNGELREVDFTSIFQKAQQFTVNLYEHQMELLKESDSIITLFDNRVYALKEGAYDKQYGVNIQGDSEIQFLAF